MSSVFVKIHLPVKAESFLFIISIKANKEKVNGFPYTIDWTIFLVFIIRVGVKNNNIIITRAIFIVKYYSQNFSDGGIP